MLTYKYDWKSHLKRIDKLFEEYKANIIEKERRKMQAIIDGKKVESYMRYYIRGLNSNTGTIMIEGEKNQYLEIAYHSGYEEKVLFRSGYFKGLLRAAETKNHTSNKTLNSQPPAAGLPQSGAH